MGTDYDLGWLSELLNENKSETSINPKGLPQLWCNGFQQLICNASLSLAVILRDFRTFSLAPDFPSAWVLGDVCL